MSTIDEIRSAELDEMFAEDRRTMNQRQANVHLANLGRKRMQRGRSGRVLTRLMLLELIFVNGEMREAH